MNCKQLGLTACVVVIGVSAAWPFRRQVTASPVEKVPLPQSRPFAGSSPGITLERPDVTLQLAGESEPSPAIDLLESEQAASPAIALAPKPREDAAAIATSTLPPALPTHFKPILPDLTSGPEAIDSRARIDVAASGASMMVRDDAPRARGDDDHVDPRAAVPWMTENQQPFPRPPKKLRRHAIQDGDSLERLAERYLGEKSRANEIYALNRELLTSPDLLPLGRVIMIPPRDPAESPVVTTELSENRLTPVTASPPLDERSNPYGVARPVSSGGVQRAPSAAAKDASSESAITPIGEPPPPEDISNLPSASSSGSVPPAEAEPAPKIIELPLEPL